MSDSLPGTSELAKLLLYEGFRPSLEVDETTHDLSKGEALRWTASRGLSQLVRRLIDEGVDVNAKGGEYEASALHYAAEESHYDVMNILLDAGASLSVPDWQGQSALHYVAGNNEDGRAAAAMTRVLKGRGADIAGRDLDGRTPLHVAARAGTCEVIQALFDMGGDISCADNEGFVPLHSAAHAGQLEVLQLLVKLGANVSQKSNDGTTALFRALRFPKIMKYLIDSGCDYQEKDNRTNTLLMYAVHQNALDAVSLLLGLGADVNLRNESGLAALHLAARDGHLELARVLMKNRADHKTGDNNGWEPLHYATFQGHIQIVEELINGGADIEARHAYESTPLLCAVQGGRGDVARFLAENNADLAVRGYEGVSALHLAVDAMSQSLVRFLVQKGADIEAKTDDGQSPLSRAAQLGYSGIVTLLLKCGADINTTTRKWWTPSHFAASGGHESVLKVLLAHKPDLTMKTVKGHLAWQTARKSKHDSIASMLRQASHLSDQVSAESDTNLVARLVTEAARGSVAHVTQLLHKGADVNGSNLDGRRAILSAAEYGQTRVLEVLLDRGADPNLTDPTGESALWWASRYGHRDVVRWLISWGADVNATNLDGQSSLSVAAQKGHLDIVSIFLKQGCSPDSSVAYGQTALLLAAANDHSDVVEVLLKSGAAVNFKTPENDTALSLAQEHQYDGVVQVLRKYQALLPEEIRHNTRSVKISDFPETEQVAVQEQMIDLQNAASQGRIAEMVRLIRVGTPLDGMGDGNAPLISAAMAGHTDAIRMLIQHGADINVLAQDGLTCFGLAASWGKDHTLKLLHEQGARIEHYDSRGRTALCLASAYGHLSTVQLLLYLGAKREWKDWEKKTPLLHAVEGGHQTVVKLLVKQGANIECVDQTGSTPLNVAVKCGHRDIAQFFLENGAQMRPDSTWNAQPLAFAAYGGFEGILTILIDHGADLNHQNDYQKTAMHWAVEKGHGMVVKMLIEAGARLDLKDDFDRVPLSLAKEKCQEACVKLLSQAATLRESKDNTPETTRKEEGGTPGKRSAYQYQALPGEGYIRVIELLPGKMGDVISIELDDVRLDTKPTFGALSYEWKEKVGTIPIECNGKDILITPNCKAAIESLRHESMSRFLWIDAICINQADDQERSQQVARMADIYRSARAVLMWLGADYGLPSIGAAFRSIKAMVQVHEKLRKEPVQTSFLMSAIWKHEEAQAMARSILEDGNVASGFKDLYWRQYFTRAWIFQEAILAGTRGVIMCGQYQCPWREFEPAMLAYKAYSGAVNESFTQIVQHDDWYSKAGGVPIELAIKAMAMLDASDPRDKIFATLELATTVSDSPRKPNADYTLTTLEVFVNTAIYLIVDSSEGAECWDWRNRRSSKTISGLPSWVPDFSLRESGLTLYPFEDPEPGFEEMVQGRPTATKTSMVINSCIIDRVVFKWTITTETDVMAVVMPTVRALADQDRGLYDPYLNKADDTQSLNGNVLLSTILESGVTEDEEDEDADIFDYVAWKLSTDNETPSRSRRIPQSLQDRVATWHAKSKTSSAFDLDICQAMDERLQLGTDVILTERGHFGLTNGGEAQVGLLLAVVGGAEALCLLEQKAQGSETWFEYVDTVYLRHLYGEFDTLDRVTGDASVRRVEFR